MNKKSLILLTSLVLGSITGLLFKDFSYFIKPLGTLFINLMFSIVVPLVFFTISTSIMKTKKNTGKILKKTIYYFFLTSFIATVLMLFATLIFNSFTSSYIEQNSTTFANSNFLEVIVSAISVNDFNLLFSRSNMLAIILFSILFGLSCKSERIIKLSEDLKTIFLKIIDKIMLYAPIGIFAFMASNIAEYGNDLFKSYINIFILYTVVSILYFFIMNSLYAYQYNKKEGIKTFFKNILPSLSTSLATQSSLATLPINLKSAKEMNLNKEVSEIVLPLGSTMNMHGSCMSAIIKIMFLFTLFNIEFLTPTNIILAIIISIISGVVMSGVPGGGLIGESLIVSLYGFNPVALGYLATIGYIVDAPATVINATTDLSVTMMISKEVEKS